MKRLRLMLGAALVWAGLALPLPAEVIGQFRDWQLIRLPDGCRIASVLVSPASGALLLEALLMPADQPESMLIALRVPVGAFLPAGISYRHVDQGRQAIGLEWLSCDTAMCTAAGQLSAQALARLQRDRSVFVGFRPTQDARPVNLEVSLMGFTAAYRALASCVPG